MAITDATLMVNYFPEVGKVRLRKGSVSHSTGFTGNVDFLFEYHSGTTRQLIGADATTIRDASTEPSVELSAGLTSGQWIGTNFNGLLGMVNGNDLPKSYDGTTVTNMTVSGPADITQLNFIAVFKNRTYFIENNSLSFWYSELNALGGTLTEFPLYRIHNLGGKLISIANWSIDAGDGPDDYIAFFTTSGDVIVYRGSDPGDATDWFIIGIYQIGKPVNSRGVVASGGDIFVITEHGYISLSKTLTSEGIPPPDKISGAAREAVRIHGTKNGWQALNYHQGNMIIINTPTNSQFQQHVINSQTGSPTLFKGWNARVFGVYNKNLYFGGTDGVVYQADIGDDDSGTEIIGELRSAWSNLNIQGEKQITAFKVVHSTVGTLNMEVDVSYDFNDSGLKQTSSSTASGTPWGSPWGSPWSPPTNIRQNWVFANGFGTNVSIKIKTSTTGQRPEISRIDFMVMPLA